MILLAVMGLILIPFMVQGAMNGNGGGQGNGNGSGYGNGNGNGSGNGNGNGTGTPAYNILDGTPFSFSGAVVSCGIGGDGLVVSTENGNLTVTGLGSAWYWDSLDMTKPVVGDAVSGNGYTVDYNGVVKNVLTDITVNGTTVQLRDSDGRPLWRGKGGGGHWGTPGTGGYAGPNYHILNGIPFTYDGEVISASVTNLGIRGDGLVIATPAGNVNVVGLGPAHYWDSLGVTRPVVGDVITVNGFTVDFNDTTVNVLMSVVLDGGVTVQLRDAETGMPLWRGGRNN